MTNYDVISHCPLGWNKIEDTSVVPLNKRYGLIASGRGCYKMKIMMARNNQLHDELRNENWE